MESPVPKENFVGILQTKCLRANESLPVYTDKSENGDFKFVCKLRDWTTEGSGFTKKLAKQNAAYKMIQKIETEKLFENLDKINSPNQLSSVSKLVNYSQREKKPQPVFSDLGKEGEMFVYECCFEKHSETGKGVTKREAKEKAANEVASFFKIHEYHNNLIKSKQRRESLSNPIQQLFEFCQKNGFGSPNYVEKEIVENKIKKYQVTCSVKNVKEVSEPSLSKKTAKLDASLFVLQKLKAETLSSCDTTNTLPTKVNFPSPDSSPAQSLNNEETEDTHPPINLNPPSEANPSSKENEETLSSEISLVQTEKTEESSTTKRSLSSSKSKETHGTKLAKLS